MTSWVLAAVLIGQASAVAAAPAQPGTEIAFSGGRVSLSAFDAPVADVLAAWAQAGHVDLAGTEYLGTRRLTLRLTNTPEADALRAIVGASSWFSTVDRDTPAASESAFRRIVILREAGSAAGASEAQAPENRYTYYSDPDADARALALSATGVRPQTTRPPDVDPESFYQYDAVAPDPPDTLIVQPPAFSRQPLHPTIGIDPEVLYTYAPTPEPLIPIGTSSFIPPTPALDPEVRFAYDPTPEIPAYMLPPTSNGGVPIPGVPVVEGLTGLRLPGRVVFRIVNEG